MPKVKITETDNTGSATLNPITNVVFIPGKAGTKMKEPVLLSSLNELSNAITKHGLVDDLSLKLAKRLIQLGMQVLYQGFEGNGDTITWTPGNYIADINEDLETQVKSFTVSGESFTIGSEEIVTVKKYKVTHHHSGEKDTYSNEYLHFNVVDGVCEIKIGNLILDENDEVEANNFKLFVDIPVNPETGYAQYQTLIFDYVNQKVGYNWLGIASGGITISSKDWELLSDKALYDIRFLTTGGYALPSQEMVNCAAKRGDCVALIDHAHDLKDVTSIRGAIYPFTTAKDAKTGAYLSKYAAAFTPWFKTNVEDFGNELIPPSFGYLFAYARSIQSNPTWYAVAGTFRGNIPELKEVAKKYSTAEIEMLQGRAAGSEVELDGIGDNVGFAINPIAYVRGYGYLVWGIRTLNVNEVNSSTKAGILKATSFLNVRNLCSDIVKTLYAAARRYTFEQNSNTLWLNFKHQIQPLLDRMVSGNGIGAYTFEQLPTEAKARLRARITITPIEGVEDFELELCLEDSLEVIE